MSPLLRVSDVVLNLKSSKGIYTEPKAINFILLDQTRERNAFNSDPELSTKKLFFPVKYDIIGSDIIVYSKRYLEQYLKREVLFCQIVKDLYEQFTENFKALNERAPSDEEVDQFTKETFCIYDNPAIGVKFDKPLVINRVIETLEFFDGNKRDSRSHNSLDSISPLPYIANQISNHPFVREIYFSKHSQQRGLTELVVFLKSGTLLVYSTHKSLAHERTIVTLSMVKNTDRNFQDPELRILLEDFMSFSRINTASEAKEFVLERPRFYEECLGTRFFLAKGTDQEIAFITKSIIENENKNFSKPRSQVATG